MAPSVLLQPESPRESFSAGYAPVKASLKRSNVDGIVSHEAQAPAVGGGYSLASGTGNGHGGSSGGFVESPSLGRQLDGTQFITSQALRSLNAIGGSAVSDGPAKKPNILYIMADQMAAPLLKMNDPNSPIKTPNIDALAKSGVVFSSAYCNSPLCAPSRFTMCTGQLPSKIGGYDNASVLSPEVPTYAHYLRREGYETVLAGKMHFIGPDQLHGFEHRLVRLVDSKEPG